ncbi:hypothetical protein BB560_006381 [Smittium megazygosporum]|uniref:N-acyl-aliphatic-L-amino acid amidohydrolase n=1 Tax=Smittium megazygosporum TaxID=133381 RepID=A0A2T9Y7M0_9FUNG|nr:hypothetical protein BB560_006381 [Smittium megazygosporum]
MTSQEPDCVKRFREFVRIKTVHPVPDYESSTKFLLKQAEEIGLTSQVVEAVKGKPVVILGLPGTDPSLPALMLGSHTDVVPVFEEFWTYPPFSAERVPTEDGDFKIYGRGSQDMKITSCMHLEALRRIKESGIKLKRNVFAVLYPDEEIGGQEGVKAYVETKEFADLNIGFDIDEGMLAANDRINVSYSERINGQVRLTAYGNTGHGSQFIEGTAIEKILPVINALLEKRQEQKALLAAKGDPSTNEHSGEFIAINLTMASGGKQANLVPASFTATFDVRITPKEDPEIFKSWLKDLATSNGVEVEFLFPNEKRYITGLDKSNTFVNAFYSSLAKHNIDPLPIICPAVSDCRHFRAKGIPTLGFVPVKNHTMLAHAHDEFVLESEFLSGIDIFYDLIQDMANA